MDGDSDKDDPVQGGDSDKQNNHCQIPWGLPADGESHKLVR